MFEPSSKARLTTHDLARFPDDSLFHKIARAVCEARCLPRKELFESWEVARRVRRRFRGGRVVDLCSGHGLLGQVLLLLDDSSPGALIVDRVLPASAATLHDALLKVWPRLKSRVTFRAADLHGVVLSKNDVVASIHACGNLTDVVLQRAVEAGARVAVLPCCHDLHTCETGSLSGWLNGPLAVDVSRVTRLEAAGFQVWTQTIPENITPQNRLLMAAPQDRFREGV